MKATSSGSSPNGSGLPRRIATRGPRGLARTIKTLLYCVLALYGVTWGLNILGVSTIFNGPDIHYSGIDANTGKFAVVKGCRPERLRPDRSCNKSIDFDTIVAAFPRWAR